MLKEMVVWCVNLKDKRNRITYPEDKTKEKTKYCTDNSCVAIGWAEEGGSTGWSAFRTAGKRRYPKGSKEHLGFTCAANALENMRKGDLVWVIVPYLDERRLYQIKKDDDPKTDAGQEAIDVGAYREGELLGVYHRASLEKCLQNLISRTCCGTGIKAGPCDGGYQAV